VTDFDLLVVGGGIQGASATYEASRRGLSTLLIERGDFGAGASSNSMRIAHGGLRYLQSADLSRALESIRERRRLLRLAPRWVRPLPFRLDLSGRGPVYRALFRAGLLANDLLSLHRNRGVDPDRRIPRSAYPGWHDALVEDTERVLLDVLHSAVAIHAGTRACNRATLAGDLRQRAGVYEARIEGVGDVSARAVLRCTGAHSARRPVVLSMNLVVEALELGADGVAVGLVQPGEGRNVFVVPWRGRRILGTYNRAYPYDPREPLRLEPGWVDECLDWLRPSHPELAGLSREHVRLVHAGLLPRAPGTAPVPADRPFLGPAPDGSLEVQGVKWTAAFGVSEVAVDRVERLLGRRSTPPEPVPLQDSWTERERYVQRDPALRAPLDPERPSLRRGDVLFAVEREWARTLEDVLLRRTGAAAAGHPGPGSVRATADLLARTLGWSETRTRREIEDFDAAPPFAGTRGGTGIRAGA